MPLGVIKSPDASDEVRIMSSVTPCFTKKLLAAVTLPFATILLPSSAILETVLP